MRKKYITSLKGIACLFVAIGHFLGTIVQASSTPFSTDFFDFLNTYHISFIIDANFYLYLFFIVSGYLVAKSNVSDLKQLIIRCFTRFLRLGLPILFACFIIFILSKIVPYYNDDTKAFFENNWLQNSYLVKFSFVDVLLAPFRVLFLKIVYFNTPYWVLRSMLFASTLIYVCSYIRFKVKSEFLRIPILLLFLGLFFVYDKIVFSSFIGAVLCYYEDEFSVLLKNKILLYLSGILSLILIFINYFFGMLAIFSWLVLAIPLMSRVEKFFELKLFEFFGEISFGIYSFHWPIFCSVGCMSLIGLWEIFGKETAFLTSIIVSLVLTIILSIGFLHIVEKPCDKIVALVRNKLSDVFNKI